MRRTNVLTYLFIAILICGGCEPPKTSQEEKPEQQPLPILGRSEVVIDSATQEEKTIYHTIADFEFVNQDSVTVTNETFDGNIYVSDFFFTSCPTICPIMKKEMLRVYDSIKLYDDVKILSHTIDPEYDTVALLHDFADRMGVTSDRWHFVTGEKEKIYEIAQTSYNVTAGQDASAPGGFIHSGAFILIDKDRRVRGFYDGTIAANVNVLINDIKRLRKEYE